MPFSIVKNKLSDFRVSSTTGNTKRKLDAAVHGVKWTHFTSFSENREKSKITGHMSSDGKYVYAMHSEKRRAKFKKMPNGKMKKLSDRSWKNTVYRFDISRVVFFEQYDRHFKVILS